MSWSRTLKVRQLLRTKIEAGEEIALLFSDLRGFSSYAVHEGDRAAFELTQVHEEVLRQRISEYGIVVKSLGDGVMAAFESPSLAIQAAVGVQQDLRARNAARSSGFVDVGIGLACGTPIMTDIDFIGHAVNLAQRLSDIAKGGQILTTESVQRASPVSAPLHYIPLGARTLRGIGTDEIVEVAWLQEVARISDARDVITLILTSRKTIVAEIAKDSRQEAREAFREMLRAQPSEEGRFSAYVQRALGWLGLWLLSRSAVQADAAREQNIHAVRLSYRGSALRVRTPQGGLKLLGVEASQARMFIEMADRLRRNEPAGSP